MSPTIDELVAQAAPISDCELRALDGLECLADELSAAIMREPREAVPSPRGLRGRRPRRPGRSVAALAIAVCAAIVLAATSFLGADQGAQRAWAAEAVRVANAVPRLLLGDSEIQRADQFSVDFGEMTFVDGERRLDLKWNRVGIGAALTEGRRSDRESRVVARTQVLGHSALIYRVGPGRADDYLAGVWRQGGYELELRSGWPGPQLRDSGELVALLRTLRAVGVDEWLSAMPANVVLPVDREKVVRAMLADIPVPAAFDAARLATGDSVRDRYQLGALVAGAAACAWIEQWVSARSSGDAAAEEQAEGAMGTSRNWKILREMHPEGAYPLIIWKYADAIAGSGTVMGGKILTVEESVGPALGCGEGD
ncbi:MAG TPA: hypothetical protein VNA28_05260 [Solirubrobacteraceae bacterium]|nr:hypothetical protein [Solirubrobacteraceae bacterium]